MTAALQKIAVHAVLELCTHSKYLHMRLELLFHVVCLIFCLEVRFVQYRPKKSDLLIIATESLYNLSEVLGLLALLSQRTMPGIIPR